MKEFTPTAYDTLNPYLETPKKRGWNTLFAAIKADFQAVFVKDPSIRSWQEVITCNPGFQALFVHRFTHILHQNRFYWFARFIAYLSRWVTGIEIHPGATLGKGIVIDHGMGVVIGETAILGDNVLIYQGVTLGGTGKQKGKRHPTLGNNVVVGAGAKVLGDIFIGDNSRIGAGSVTLSSVDHNCTVVGIPGRVVRRSGEKVDPLAHNQIPDPIADLIHSLMERVEQLDHKFEHLPPSASLKVTRFAQSQPTPNPSQEGKSKVTHSKVI